MAENKDCSTGWCGPAPFANTPPIGLAPELQKQEDVLPDWKQIAPDLPVDAYATADALWWSRKLGAPQALGADLAPLLTGEDDARAVQRALARTWDWWPADRAPRYWKSGGASRDAALLHVPLPENGIHLGLATVAAPQTVFNLRGVEAEIALRIGQDVSAEQATALDDAGALALVDGVTVAIEWVDVRWRDGLKAPALALLADGQCHGGLALGDWLPASSIAGRDWSQQRCTVTVNGGEARLFTGTHSLGDPAWLLRDWLQHVAREYGRVPAGTVVTTGTWCGCMPLQAGDAFEMEFEGVGRLGWQF
ncbi:MAG: fumarylacetoacetate hydrolase family protein [Comamonas sp.]|jgi:2-keto-4-pentenoate hydratase|uniref:fumarylacetoacetate hydrolase family protein n=1 Tax=Comamonas sp. TaxID=34028 RepID=UPI002822AA5A|nr:fumarylacetoacetate hydrolase family protein [Comamonas sp.]MDR0216533.1 fumarylacetoacetate hydrolase family protein [Comamonas sp.]